MLRFFLAVTLSLLPALPAHAQDAHDPHAVVRNAVEGFIRPGYRAFAAATGGLRAGMTALCETPTPEALSWARERLVETAKAFAEIELVRFGPIAEDNRIERLLFWPDRKGAALRQVQALLAEKDPSATTPDGLAGKSVALQGLGALEFVLYGTGAETLSAGGDPFRCTYGDAVAQRIDGIAGQLVAAWDDPEGIARALLEPGPDKPLFRTDEEALTEIADVFVHGLELLRDVRINGFLGKSADEDRPKQALFWRSGATIATLRGNISGLRALYFVSGIGGLLKPDESWISEQIAFEFDNARGALTAADAPVADALADPAKRSKLEYARVVTSSLLEDFGTRLTGALGITAGFSSLDGD